MKLAQKVTKSDELTGCPSPLEMIGPLAYMEEKYGEPIGIGRHRTVFRDGDWVYKVPHDAEGWGMADNYTEANGPMWTDAPELFAECCLVTIQGFQVLKMEYVEHRGWLIHEEPDWTWSIDGGQVGHTKDGRLVAYDWGY